MMTDPRYPVPGWRMDPTKGFVNLDSGARSMHRFQRKTRKTKKLTTLLNKVHCIGHSVEDESRRERPIEGPCVASLVRVSRRVASRRAAAYASWLDVA